MRIVICCDQEVPAELLRDALVIGRALGERGHAVSFVVGDPVTLVDYAGAWTPNELYQAPVRRAGPELVMKRPQPDGLADSMAISGFEDKQTLLTLGTMWEQQLRALSSRPDVILGFYTPVLWLVAPAHAPTFALGNGSTLPPVLGTSFPRLSPDSTPLADERVMLANANAVLAKFGRPALSAISDVLVGCAPLLY